MAVSTPGPEVAGEDGAEVTAPGRHQPFEIDPRRTALYRAERAIFVSTLWAWFRPRVVGKEHVPTTGAAILAPVHRSFADFGFAAFCTTRKLFFMTKDEMWKNKALGRLLLSVGAFPVHRESADREALQRAEQVLVRGQLLVMFPEGTRREGPEIRDLMEGASFLSARTGAPILPIGIAGSDLAMPKGSQACPSPTRSTWSSARPWRPRRVPGAAGSPARPCARRPPTSSGGSSPSTTRPGRAAVATEDGSP